MKVGDTVILFRIGTIDKLHPAGEPYPVEVKFEGGSGNPAFDVVSFTADGKTFEGDEKPALFTAADFIKIAKELNHE